MSLQLTITRPDDWHIHLRDKKALEHTVKDASQFFTRVMVMPNLQPPIRTTKNAEIYRQQILAAYSSKKESFIPLMTLYLTDETTVQDIEDACASGIIYAAKLYPAGATTNSELGVTSIKKIFPVLEAMSRLKLPLLVHGEITRKTLDIFDREKAFIDEQLIPLIDRFPNLTLVLEHITTRQAVQFINEAKYNIGATVTPQHLLYNRNDLLVGGVKPHLYCLPILKRSEHQEALIQAVTGHNKRFFIGTDSAPHTQDSKESNCGCAGCYSSYCAIELYAELFDQQKALSNLEPFVSFNGPDFYQLPRNKQTITLVREPWTVPNHLPFGEQHVIPLYAGKILQWRCKERSL
ncbi:UNVERIFIED_CONTAM: hypothetical protein GTU68_062073 [Idotea baltica]|nr:hypothetical protein [Idotea baltica]